MGIRKAVLAGPKQPIQSGALRLWQLIIGVRQILIPAPRILQKQYISPLQKLQIPFIIEKKTMEIQTKDSLFIQQLVAMTSSCLLNEMRFYDSDEQRRQTIYGLLGEVEKLDPEFIPQLAVYLRRELGLRAVSNYLIAYCACSKILSKMLPEYFSKAVVLPSDVIEVMQFVQIIHLVQSGMNMTQIKELNGGDAFEIRKKIFVPNQLKKVLTSKILSYSEHQLGKYCSESYRKAVLQEYLAAKKGQISYKAKLRKARQERLKAKNKDAAEAKEEKKVIKVRRFKRIHKKQPQEFQAQVGKIKAIEKTFLTMKDVIGLLHIKPTLLTSAILGVKYPKSLEEFEKKFPKQKFDEAQAAKRMKIHTPVTWETELSSKGNKKQTWEALLSANKVPYLALLRNLRNIVNADVSNELCSKVASFVSNKENVAKNKSTPLQYLSAYQIINSLTGKKEKHQDVSEQEMEVEESANTDKQLLSEKVAKAQILSQAILIALEHSMSNCEKLKGNTLVFTDVSGSMRCPISGGKKYGSIRTCADLSILLGLMVNQNCEHCKYYIFSSVGSHPKCYMSVWDFIKNGSIMDKMRQITKKAKELGGGTDFPVEVIEQATEDKQKIDNIIIFSDMMISNGQHAGTATGYIKAIEQYKNKVNPNVKIFSVDLRGYADSKKIMENLKQRNFIRIYGGNASILKFISESEGSQIEYIRNYSKTLES